MIQKNDATPEQLACRDRLIAAAREPLVNFDWQFNNVYTEPGGQCSAAGCMIGLAYHIGLINVPSCSALSRALDVDYTPLHELLVPEEDDKGRAVPYGVRYKDVTPSMVADKLEELFSCEP